MKRLILGTAILVAALLILTARPAAAAESPLTSDPAVLCLPGVYMLDPGDCAPSGPSAYLTQAARMGMSFPMTSLPARKPDPGLTYVEYRYGLVNKPNAPVYGSIEDALSGNKKNAVRRIDSSFSYISYAEETVVDGKRLYMIDPGAWMTANDITRIGSVPLFQGLTFTRTPAQAFGWVRAFIGPEFIQVKRTPGFGTKDATGRELRGYEIVQVYDTREVDGQDWYMIGPDEWAHHTAIGRVLPNTQPPQGATGDRWIEINLYEQTLAVYDDRQLVFATLIASGLDPFWTRPGLFQITEKLPTTPMRGAFEADRSDAYYLEDVPWTMYFDKARALHGAYWRSNLGFPQSHGCVNLSVGDSRWLFDWGQVGDWVYVWDPSGVTPDDPAFYGDGGA
jgi:hypothetical protein